MATADDFRRIALSFPEAEEGAHMGHSDFRAGALVLLEAVPDEVLEAALAAAWTRRVKKKRRATPLPAREGPGVGSG
ncbi:MAG TPA: hypothetical protein VF680_06435 [Allosphingosinicella sp.]